MEETKEKRKSENEDASLGSSGKELGAICLGLPDDVIPGILSRLPFSSMIRAGGVCKQWHSLVRFLQGYQSTPWCLLLCRVHSDIEQGQGEWLSWMFDPFVRKWHKLPTPFRDTNLWTEIALFRSTGGYSGLVGMLQVDTVDGGRSQVYWVGNPITNKWLNIPAPCTTVIDHCCIVVDKFVKTYRIVSIVRRDVPMFSWEANIYESRTRTWRSGARVLRQGSFIIPGATAASNNMVYFLATGHVSWIEIISYDMERDLFGVVIPLSEFVHPGMYMNAGTFQLLLDNEFSDAHHQNIRFVAGSLEPYLLPERDTKQAGGTRQVQDSYGQHLEVCGNQVEETAKEAHCGLLQNVDTLGHRVAVHNRYRVSKICVANFLDCKKKWILEDQQIDARNWFPNATSNIFKCTGDRHHFYTASFDCPNVVVMYNGHNRKWTRLPSWTKSEIEQASVWTTSTFGSFIPRQDVHP